MDVSKYPIEKGLYFIAGVLPGFVALLVFHLARPGVFRWFFLMGFLGYQSKMILAVCAAFVIGNSMTAILSALLGGLGGGLGEWRASKQPYVAPHLHKVAPWRDQRWRIALTSRLGTKAPNDTHLLSDEIWDRRRELVNYLPEKDRPAELYKINSEKLNTEKDDLSWEQWYDHYHTIVVTNQHRKWDLADYVRLGLYFNLQTASLYLLASAFWVHALRHWWVLVPSIMWVFILFAEVYTGFARAWNKWSSLSAQITYLSEAHLESSEK